jgi:hypothetical protein
MENDTKKPLGNYNETTCTWIIDEDDWPDKDNNGANKYRYYFEIEPIEEGGVFESTDIADNDGILPNGTMPKCLYSINPIIYSGPALQ